MSIGEVIIASISLALGSIVLAILFALIYDSVKGAFRK